ncbi:DNA alkylation repair protein [Glutamicibacter uratoxydans]|uniref:DNA alkylation repair protein n=1 Tax=Glutamicibacter uratoxydans TaxID=43667 RepID=A0A4Y4DZX8_GLUUR|nr:DNA alkylation repair protein [Glutamicibacter uratoxydans]GED07911.1 DNA alkylation repair protein [Glutamicibacter uratoxydans]
MNTVLTPQSSVADVQAALAELENPKMRAVNEKHGDDLGVNLTKLRALAKALKSNQELSEELWATGDTATRLVAILICKPKGYSLDELERWLREAKTPKVQGWFVNYVAKKSKYLEELRKVLIADQDPIVASAGWELTAHQVVKAPQNLDLGGLLDTIEADMKSAPERLQWAMNNTLAQIGIEHEQLRERALTIGEKLQVLADYPTPPGCTSPFAPIWINEMVSRKSASV